MFPPWCWCLPDHHGSAPWVGPGADPVGRDEGAVHDDVRVAGGLGGRQRTVQARLAGGQHRDALVTVVVGGRPADRVVPGQLAHPGVAQEPAQHQHGLPGVAQHTGAPTDSSPTPLGVQQSGQEQDAVLGHVQDSFVCDTRGDAEPP
jgi:hypothetical protein